MFSNSIKSFTRRCFAIKSCQNSIPKKGVCNTAKVPFISQGVKTKSEHSFSLVSTRIINVCRYSSLISNDSVVSTDEKTIDDFYKVDEAAITQGDPDKLKQLKIVILEVDVARQEGLRVPSKITTEQWKQLLLCRSRSQKMKCLRFWFINECKMKNDKLKKEKKRIEREEKLKELIAQTDPNHIRYGLGANTIFVRISDMTINTVANNRLVNAMMFGQNLVIDCSYDKYMSKTEQNLCAKQLTLVFAMNRSNDDPFNIHYCNMYRDSIMTQAVYRNIPTMYDNSFPINVHECSYLDMFPKEKLVYLTPHCRTELKEFNHDDIYIIGGIVDKANCEPLSLAKAKSEGIRMAKFPLDRYLNWAIGSKSLTLDQCLAILLEVKKSGDWIKAFQHVPRRKVLQEPTESQIENMESERDKSSYYGRTYVSTHEWGLNKSKLRHHRQIKPPPVYDLRKKFGYKKS